VAISGLCASARMRGAIGVAQHHAVETIDQAGGGRGVGVGPRGARQVEQVALALVAEADELVAEGVEHGAQAGQAAPGLGVSCRRGAEGGEW